MTSQLFPRDEAASAIRSDGVYWLRDGSLGSLIKDFSKRFPIKSSAGIEFLARHSIEREPKGLYSVLESTLGKPHWGLIKVYSSVLPTEYAFRFHPGSHKTNSDALLLFLCSPDSEFALYHGSPTHEMAIDAKVSKEWGLLATPRGAMRRDGITEEPIEMKLGGVVLCDSRFSVTILKGFSICLAYATTREVAEWNRMELPYSKELECTMQTLEGKGFNINYEWEDSTAKT